jgi:hypothetical protein
MVHAGSCAGFLQGAELIYKMAGQVATTMIRSTAQILESGLQKKCYCTLPPVQL